MKPLNLFIFLWIAYPYYSQSQHFNGTVNTTSTIDRSGDVGIGTSSPLGKLHVVGNTVLGGSNGDFIFTYAWQTGEHFLGIAPNASGPGSNDWVWANGLRFEGWTGELIKEMGDPDENAFSVRYNNVKNFKVLGDGRVIIGNVSAPSGYKLYVEDGILAEKLKIAVSTSGSWADYVFDSDYNLIGLKDLELFIKEHKHLPGMLTSDEITNAGGIDVYETIKIQQEKIEELTLYLIQLNNELESIKNQKKRPIITE